MTRFLILAPAFATLALACVSEAPSDAGSTDVALLVDAARRDDVSRPDAARPDVEIVDALRSADVVSIADVAGSADVAPGPACDYRTREGIVVIEAEDLTLSEEWRVENAFEGASGNAYISWTGRSFNNDPTHGQIQSEIFFAEAGRYIVEWRSRIGQGDDPTEHNDTWVRFQGVPFYGIQGPSDAEDRVYPRPLCEDQSALDEALAEAGVVEASCPAGSSVDGWFKGYSSGARDFRFITKTSDSDAHDILIEVAAPTTLTLELAARADFNLMDRIVIRRENVNANDARDLALATTECP